ncbi:TfoX/Sxy family protein [Chelativorans intermedius]|uniref:TfoX/Sxy family protein n=1 Tax=Chelativorans intermedius TaxID=515947 RepID=A0ABV6D3L1_9HYPH|nr:TfoX/Sxy family protein [Chelativorans intermedius]MCT8996925.1 TfoX/Sxy family protein [Chelativorans intermedius]
MDDDHIRELFASLGSITIRRMFGGKGIYCEGRIFALEVDGEILLKADALSAPDFAAAGSRQWVYTGHTGRKPTAMPYWSIPDEAVDDPDVMALWARRAYEAALRARG